MPAAAPASPLDALRLRAMTEPRTLTDADWQKILTPEEFYVARRKGTERSFTGKYWENDDAGTYVCVACRIPLFTSKDKFHSSCGWPAFSAPANTAIIGENRDLSHGMVRTEVVCARCDAHLGHVFDDGPPPTNLRYCINSVSIDLVPGAPVTDFEKPIPKQAGGR